MKPVRSGAFQKIAIVSAAHSVSIIMILLVLRSAYAFTLMKEIGGQLSERKGKALPGDSLMQVNEELTYEASYLFFKVGSVKFQVLSRTTYENRPVYRLRAFIDSYSGFPFVSFHSIYDTYADAENLTCLFNAKSQKDGDSWIYTTTDLDFVKKKIEWEQTRDGKILNMKEMPLDTAYTDGVSFFYYLRRICMTSGGKETTLSVPMVEDTIRSAIHMTINEEREPCEVTACNFPLDSRKLSGHIDFVGTFGVSGDFEGWISGDSTCMPLRGKLKVILGSIVVQLKEVDRKGWSPPKSVNGD